MVSLAKDFLACRAGAAAPDAIRSRHPVEKLQALIDFAMAASLLGMQYAGTILDEESASANALNSLTASARAQLSEFIRPVSMLAAPPATLPLPGGLSSAPGTSGTTTFVRVSLGTATVRHGIDGRGYFIVHADLKDSAGNSDGEFEGVWAAREFNPADLVSYPPAQAPPFDRPLKPGASLWEPKLNPTKSRFTFGQGDGWLDSVGPALSRIQVQGTGATQFWYSVASFISGGGGHYADVRGQAVSIASADFPSVPQLSEGLSFPVEAIHVIKVARGS